MELSANARAVLEKRYLRRENGQVIETPEILLRRVAESIASVEQVAFGASAEEVSELAEAFFLIMDERKFMPNSPTLMNAGRELGQLSACFVLPIEDSMESIFETLKIAALIHKSGGGTGFSFSELRPKNDQVGSTGGVASGPISFLKVFNASTEAVKQGGTRRGANMGVLQVDHPDILEFIELKRNKGELSNFNLSVGITDSFMEAVEQGVDYFLVNPRTKEATEKLFAREVLEKIVAAAWECGEPGVIFLDRINENNPTPEVGAFQSTNPCGEQPLLPFESCNLGSINLSVMLKKDQHNKLEIDWDELRQTVFLAVRFLDNVIEANRFPLAKIEQITKSNRKIGLGIMGWADLLIKLRLSYQSEAAIQLGEEIMRFIDEQSKLASIELAQTRGAFSNFYGSKYELEGHLPLRNATTTTLAPTGTISIICDTSGGIEPLFSLAFTRKIMDNQSLIEVNKNFEALAREEGFYSQELIEKISLEGSISKCKEIPEELKQVLLTAHEILPEWHIRMQAAFQKYTDNAVSKTINFPHQSNVEQVAEAYQLAYRLKCKGLTVYRDGCLENQPMQLGTEKSALNNVSRASISEKRILTKEWGHLVPVKRPKSLTGITDARQTPEGNLYLTLNFHQEHPFELFAQIGKAGSDISAFTEAMARLISLAFRAGIDPQVVAEELLGIGGSRFVGFGSNRVRSVPDAIGQFINEHLQQVKLDELGHLELKPQKTSLANGIQKIRFNLCPICGMHTFGYVEGCGKCFSCGHSEC